MLVKCLEAKFEESLNKIFYEAVASKRIKVLQKSCNFVVFKKMSEFEKQIEQTVQKIDFMQNEKEKYVETFYALICV